MFLMKTVCCGCSKSLPDIIFVNNERDETNPRPQLRVKHNFIGDFIENALLLYLGVLPHHTLEPKDFTHQTVSLLYTIGPSGNAGTEGSFLLRLLGSAAATSVFTGGLSQGGIQGGNFSQVAKQHFFSRSRGDFWPRGSVKTLACWALLLLPP